MRRQTILLLATATIIGAVFTTLPLASTADAQTGKATGDRYFLKIDGVDGEVSDAGYVGSVALRSFSWNQPRGTSTSGVVEPKSVHFVLWTDKAAPILLRKTGALERLPKVTLIARNAVGMDYLKWTFTDGVITSFGTEGALGDNRPSIMLDVVFAKADMEYRQQQQNGGLSGAIKGWWELVLPK